MLAVALFFSWEYLGNLRTPDASHAFSLSSNPGR